MKKSRFQKCESEIFSEEKNFDDWKEKRDEAWFCFVCQFDETIDMRLSVSFRKYVEAVCDIYTISFVDLCD